MIEFDNNLPIYLQIMNYLKKEIIRGALKPGEKVPSVRELASELQINPNTVQRTLSELEREGILETRRGLGRYVTSEESIIMNIKKEMAGDLIHHFLQEMIQLGFTKHEIVSIVNDAVIQEHAQEERGGAE